MLHIWEVIRNCISIMLVFRRNVFKKKILHGVVDHFYFILDHLRNSVISPHFIVNIFYYIYHTIKHRLLYKKLLTRFYFEIIFGIFFIKNIYSSLFFWNHFFFFQNTYEEFESGLIKFKFTRISNASIVSKVLFLMFSKFYSSHETVIDYENRFNLCYTNIFLLVSFI